MSREELFCNQTYDSCVGNEDAVCLSILLSIMMLHFCSFLCSDVME